jgi:hypothetical protein
MEKGKIIITENGVKIIPANGNVWLPEWQIAELFGVFYGKVSSNIRSILKSDILRTEDVSYCYHYSNGNSVDLYNLEMITAKVRGDTCSIRQTSLFVINFSPFRWGVRFFNALPMQSSISSSPVKKERIASDFLSSISMIPSFQFRK